MGVFLLNEDGLSQHPTSKDQVILEFSGNVKRGESFHHSFGNRFLFILSPLDLGWEVVIRDQHRPAENLARLTPPFHSAPNPRELEGWHFRNAGNTGENQGDVHAPGKDREFIFSPHVGTLYHYPPADDALEEIRRDGSGVLTITEMTLGNLLQNQTAWFENMRFMVRLHVGKDFHNNASPERIWKALLREMIQGNEEGVHLLSSPTGLASLYGNLPSGETRGERLIRFGTIWQKWEARWRTIDSVTVQISIGPEVKAHLIEFKNISGTWKFNLWLPGE